MMMAGGVAGYKGTRMQSRKPERIMYKLYHDYLHIPCFILYLARFSHSLKVMPSYP